MESKKALKELRDKLQPNVINGDNALETLNNALLIDLIEKDLEALEKIQNNFDIWVYEDEINIQANIGGEIARKKFKEKDVDFFEEWLDGK